MTGRSLISCVGDLQIERRCGYCPRCRATVVSFDRWAGLRRDTLTPRGRRMAALAGSRMSFDEASDHLRALCGIRVSDQTIRRACDGVGQQARAYLQQEVMATEPVADAVGERECTLDGAKVNTTEGWREIRAVVMCKREPGQPAGVRHWKKRNLPAPAARVVWAGIADHQEVGQRVKGLADRLGWGRDRGRGVSVLGDGIGWIWNQCREHLPEHEGCLDLWHVMEHLHVAGRVLLGQGDEARRWAELQRAKLFRYGARGYLQKHLLPQVKTARRDDPDGEPAQALRSLLLYLWKHRGRMRYRDRLRRGLPIGSGQIEGVCKNTLNRRLRKNSPRWRPERANHMAALCCLHTSNQWDRFWSQAA